MYYNSIVLLKIRLKYVFEEKEIKFGILPEILIAELQMIWLARQMNKFWLVLDVFQQLLEKAILIWMFCGGVCPPRWSLQPRLYFGSHTVKKKFYIFKRQVLSHENPKLFNI